MHEQTLFAPDRIKAFLFDLDGTLIESNDRWTAKLAAGLGPLARLSKLFDPDSLAHAIVMNVEIPSNYVISALEHLGLESRFFGLADRIRRARGLATRELSDTVSGTHHLLETLHSSYKLAVVTTRARPEAYAFLAGGDLERYFPVVITRQDVLRLKPHPEPVLTAAGMLGVAPEACVMIGDTVADIRSARRAGAIAVGVLSGFGRRQELERAGADIIVDYAEDLLRLPEWDSQLD